MSGGTGMSGSSLLYLRHRKSAVRSGSSHSCQPRPNAPQQIARLLRAGGRATPPEELPSCVRSEIVRSGKVVSHCTGCTSGLPFSTKKMLIVLAG
jgi:hypothetical protein